MSDSYLIIEVWDLISTSEKLNPQESLLGLLKLPLHNLCMALNSAMDSNDDIVSDGASNYAYPAFVSEGHYPIMNPLSGANSAVCQLLFSVGDAASIHRYHFQSYRTACITIQKYVRRLLARRRVRRLRMSVPITNIELSSSTTHLKDNCIIINEVTNSLLTDTSKDVASSCNNSIDKVHEHEVEGIVGNGGDILTVEKRRHIFTVELVQEGYDLITSALSLNINDCLIAYKFPWEANSQHLYWNGERVLNTHSIISDRDIDMDALLSHVQLDFYLQTQYDSIEVDVAHIMCHDICKGLSHNDSETTGPPEKQKFKLTFDKCGYAFYVMIHCDGGGG